MMVDISSCTRESGADDLDKEATLIEEVFQPLPFQVGRDDSPRLIILGFLQGKFTHGYTGRDYWITDVEANGCGVRAVMIAPSPISGAVSRGRAVRRTVDEFISAFLSEEPATGRPPATPARHTAAAGGGTPTAQLTLAGSSLDVSRRPLGKALRLWPRWAQTAPSLANPATAAIDDLAELLGPLMGREVRGRTAVISALAKVDGQLSFEARRKASLRTVVETKRSRPRIGDEGDATDSGDSEGDDPPERQTRHQNATPTRTTLPPADDDSDDGAQERPTLPPRRGRQVTFPAEELRQLTPSGVPPLAAARLFFKVRELAEAASFVLPDDLDEPSERSAYEESAGRAFQRLRELIGRGRTKGLATSTRCVRYGNASWMLSALEEHETTVARPVEKPATLNYSQGHRKYPSTGKEAAEKKP
ncbi:hypothetical protein AB1Y20_022500 [Prymnesium parvum]|uniref:Uncharacterized protein n=1 Tax=Prymnesium parvum TaxID=97485 RepID=A0AB34JGG2_PRYPA